MHRMSRYIFLLIILSVLAKGTVYGQTVTMGPILDSAFCTGDSITVNFAATGFWGHKNTFTLQISDPSGSFQTAFTNLASIEDTLPGTLSISTIIPGGTTPSSAYRFRIASAIPYIATTDNGRNIRICIKPYIPYVELGNYFTFEGNPQSFRVDAIPDASITWDFGPDATPRTAGGQLPGTTFAAGGDKLITITVFSTCGCSATGTYRLHVFDCTNPIIPSDAKVIDGDSTSVVSGVAYWVNPGAKLTLFNTDHDTIFAESGSVIAAKVHCSSNIYYLKMGASITNEEGVPYNLCIYADGSSGGTVFGGSFSCPNLNFDYSSAPPNPAHLSVPSNSIADSRITVSPNPTTGSISIQGAPSNDLNVHILY